MMQELLKKKSLLHILAAALLYSAATIPLKYIFALIPGAELRISAFLPVLLGLIWGLPGAIGIALGNVIGDLSINSSLYVCIFGAIGNFIFSYMPYKMWYSIRVDSFTASFIPHIRNLLKFLIILLITSYSGSVFVSLVADIDGLSPVRPVFQLIFINNFDFPLLLATPILILLSSRGYDFVVPKPTKSSSPVRSHWFEWILMISLILSAGMLLAFYDAPDHLAIVLQILLLLYCFKPIPPLPKQELPMPEVKYPIHFKVTLGSLLFVMIFILTLGLSTVGASSNDQAASPLAAWVQFYRSTFYSVHLFFAAFLIFLWQAEKHLVRPLLSLTLSANSFANRSPDEPLLQAPHIPVIGTGDEIEVLSNAFKSMMTDIEHYVVKLHETVAERERITAELNIAMHIQTSLLPPTMPINQALPQLHVAAMMYPAREVGGDFYDCFLIDDDHLAIIIADVSGKGVPAALFMVIAKTLLRTNLQAGLTPAMTFAKTNDELCENNTESMFVTAFLAVYECSTHQLTYVNAGHTRPVLLSDGELRLLKDRSGPVLASMDGLSYREFTCELHPGNLLFLYTDGVTEAQNQQQEFFGEEQLCQELGKLTTERDKDDAAQCMQQKLEAFKADAEQFDDITMLTLHIRQTTNE